MPSPSVHLLPIPSSHGNSVGGGSLVGKLVGFAGRATAGKTAAADILVAAGYSKLSFALPVKYLVRHFLYYFGYSPSQVDFFERNKSAVIPDMGVTIRVMWQTIGTDWGRVCVNPSLWVMAAEQRLLRTQTATQNKPVVFDDVRFENEAQFIRDHGGIVVHIQRLLPVTDSHSSEAGIVFQEGDFIINNNTGFDNFTAVVKGFA